MVAFDPPDGLCPRGEEAGAGEVLDEIVPDVGPVEVVDFLEAHDVGEDEGIGCAVGVL